MRYEGKIKLGYYLTPLTVVERVASFVNFLDRCCGEGLALGNFAERGIS
jgi:hypothetical protein